MRILFTLLVATLLTFSLTAQKWVSLETLPYAGDRRIEPHTALLLKIDGTSLRQQLFAAPHESVGAIRPQLRPLELPLPDGGTARFDIVAYDIMPTDDQARFPNIRTWYGRNREHPEQTIFLDWTEFGFHASITGGGATVHVEPLFRGDTDLYQIFRVTDFDEAVLAPIECGSHEDKTEVEFTAGEDKTVGGCALRQYRTAISTDQGYSNYFGATSAAQANLVQSAVVTALNRANQILTQSISLRHQLITGNDRLYIYNQASDPFDGLSLGEALSVNQNFTDSEVGYNNYDHGHLFVGSFSSGGIAQLSSSCRGGKAQAASSGSQPEGFFFDTRILTHEMGHSFGAPHTYSNVCNNQQGIPVEPGSGSTLMSYAGVCTPNVVGVVEAYFHGRSIDQMTSYIELGSGSCGTIIDNALTNPVITAQPDYTIPAGTPIRLKAVATGSDELLFNWEQFESEAVGGEPQPTQTLGSVFRSFAPVSDAVRFIPQLPEVVAGNSPTWEVIPEVSRVLNFRATIINQNTTYGCASEDDVVVNVLALPGNAAFEVTYPNGPNQWASGQANAVIWDVAGTDAAPYNTSMVDIYYSSDGGNSFSLLVEDTPNDGYAELTIPNQTNLARIMITAADNVFFTVNDDDISVGSTISTPNIGLGTSQTTSLIDCNAQNDAPNFEIQTTNTGNAVAPITWSISGLPDGLTASYSANPSRPTQPLRIFIEGIESFSGNASFQLLLTGTSTDGNLSQPLQLAINRNGPAATFRVAGPLVESSSLRPRLRAIEEAGVTYEHELRNTGGSNELIFAATGTQPTVSVPDFLAPGTDYQYRVRVVSECGTSDWSTQVFSTPETCITVTTDDAPRLIDPNLSQQQVTQKIAFPAGASVIEMNVLEVDITHTWLGDLTIDLLSPEGTSVQLFDRSCRSDDDILAGWVDRAADPLSCPPVNNELLAPTGGQLALFNGQELAGEWMLRVNDLAGADGGFLNTFTLQVCFAGALLPVEWLSFEVTPQKDHLRLDWATASEFENAGFYVERTLAASGSNWSDLGFVAADTDYRFADRTALPYTDYLYRLRQTDLDGSVDYSDVQRGRFGDDDSLERLLFPNPATNLINYRIAKPANYALLDVTGRTLQTGTLATAGTLQLNELPNGIYLLRAGTFTRRIIKR